MKKEKDKKKRREKKAELVATPETTPSLDPSSETDSNDSMQYLSAVLSGKWKLRILWALRSGQGRRYGEIKQEVSGITDMMLSQSLREMTADGLTERQQYQEIPPRVEYRITSSAADMIPALSLLVKWAAKQTRKKQ